MIEAPQNETETALQQTLLVFFRSPAGLASRFRRLWSRSLPEEEWQALLQAAPLAFRDNVMRLLVGARWCLEHEAPLVLVEGWRCHVIEAPGARPARVVDGSHLGGLILCMLRRRKLLPELPTVWSNPQSRCTAEEWQVARDLVEYRSGHLCAAVAGPACPSPSRAQRYISLAGMELKVFNALEAAAQSSDFVLRTMYESCRERGWEALYNRVFETLNYGIYYASCLEALLAGRPSDLLLQRLEVRLTRRFRKHI